MLNNATVTMPYKELQELINKIEEQNEIVKVYKRERCIEAFEADPYKQSLDTIFNLAEEASKYSNANEKQFFIYKIMSEYCRVFKIPEIEVMEDISKGISPVGRKVESEK